VTFGKSVRKLWSRSNTPENDATYANFAFGDETLSAVYGGSLQRLKVLKMKWDPKEVFDQWFFIW
jgi:hypothetical protein